MLKVNKDYQPCSPIENDEVFRAGIFVWNISRIKDFIEKNKSEFKPAKIEVKKYHQLYSRINEDHLSSVDLSIPVILAEINPIIKYSVIDGHHRNEKAYRDGVEYLYVYKLSVKQHVQFFTSIKSYKTFVEYWNEKCANR
ncbi:hypothetical protein C0971_08110 [Bacillus methanolicus]|uniref:hypothetical protein n=1 Tax=Bacillus methanolicus TaxID=1471 RepID=UPI0020103EDC|nr:hypothetical protein [Bacillus methanolicus]UQD51987.1 hypothetical protein C0971_08110 [Bacillus methanolicus]